MSGQRCSGKTKHGTPCRAFAAAGGATCVRHSGPAAGGKQEPSAPPIKVRDLDLTTAVGLETFFARLLGRAGELPVTVATLHAAQQTAQQLQRFRELAAEERLQREIFGDDDEETP